MRFRTVVIAAVVLVVATVAALSVLWIADLARQEAAQDQIDRTDSLAVEPGYQQYLVPDEDHDPTSYDANVTVTYNDTTWQEGTDYEYAAENGTIEFLRDEPGSASVAYGYEIPENQVVDEQAQTSTEAFNTVALLGVGLSFVVLLLFIGGFAAKRLSGGRSPRGR